jgi:hypothetical protein
MNQTFSLGRFGRLLRNYFTNNQGQLLTNLTLLTSVMLVGFVLIYSEVPPEIESLRSPLCLILGWAAWYVFIWQQTDVLNHKERAITYLLQPASGFEKILLLWLISGVGFVLVYGLLFSFFDAIAVAFVNQREWTADQLSEIKMRGGLTTLVPVYQTTQFSAPLIILVYTALLHPFALAFLLTVRRYNLALVAVLAFVLITAGFFLNTFLIHRVVNMTSAVSGYMPFGEVVLRSPDEATYRYLNLPQPVGNKIRYVVGILAVVLLYITAWFRLKEREV